MLSGTTIMRVLTSMIMEMLKLRSGMPTMQVQMNMILGIPMLRDVRISMFRVRVQKKAILVASVTTVPR